MTDKTYSNEPTPDATLAALRELIGALDRRIPHVERTGENAIVRDAWLLRHEAVARIEELRAAGSDGDRYNPELGEAVMTDDGARLT